MDTFDFQVVIAGMDFDNDDHLNQLPSCFAEDLFSRHTLGVIVDVSRSHTHLSQAILNTIVSIERTNTQFRVNEVICDDDKLMRSLNLALIIKAHSDPQALWTYQNQLSQRINR